VNALEAARDYVRRGWRIAPVPAGQKRCRYSGWPNLVITLADLPNLFGDGGNVAVVLGVPSGELVDVDLDCDEALPLADLYLPKTGAVFGRKSRPGSHRLYIAPGAGYASFADPLDGHMLIELRAGGAHQTLLPPSVADGEQRRWRDQVIAPAVVEADKLRRRCAYLAMGCLMARHVSPHAALHPQGDLPRLLWEADEDLGRAAFHWLGQMVPDEQAQRRRPIRSDDFPLDLDQIVDAIPNHNCAWPEWNSVGMAIFAATQGSQVGLQLFHKFSSRSDKYKPGAVAERWANYRRHPPTKITIASLIYWARQAGWQA
jgi:hypothetical protein